MVDQSENKDYNGTLESRGPENQEKNGMKPFIGYPNGSTSTVTVNSNSEHISSVAAIAAAVAAEVGDDSDSDPEKDTSPELVANRTAPKNATHQASEDGFNGNQQQEENPAFVGQSSGNGNSNGGLLNPQGSAQFTTSLRDSSQFGSSLFRESQTYTRISTEMLSPSVPGGLKKRRSSLELRKLPVNVLLNPSVPTVDEDISMEEDGDRYMEDETTKKNCLKRTCLNARYTLRTQMLLSFGILSACTILLVVITCVVLSVASGEIIKSKTRDTFDKLADVLEGRAARFIAEGLAPRIFVEDVVQILFEATRDRFAGYPIYEDDSQVPFFDTLSQSNQYPILGKPIPLDWQIESNIDESNYQEHVQNRWSWYGNGDAMVNTETAAFMMQGICDPEETNSTITGYFPNCTAENNNITTGGVYAPTSTTSQVHRKASDLVPLQKAIYEFHQECYDVGIFFANSGAGATSMYPALQLSSTSNYTSIGCQWLRSPHPYNSSRSIMSDEEIDLCQKSAGNREFGATVPSRLYSPLDRAWCRNQVLHPDQVTADGPYLDAFSDEGLWLLTVGRAVFDRITNELVACLAIDLAVDQSIGTILENSRVTKRSHVSVVRMDDIGTVLASTAWNASKARTTVHITDIDVGLAPETFEQLRNLVNFSKPWEHDKVNEVYESHFVDGGEFQIKSYPIPPPPTTYDADYRPQFLVVFSVSASDLYIYAEQVEDDVNHRILMLTILSIAVGTVGFGFVMAALFLVSSFITMPLRRMNDTARLIMDTFGGGPDEKINIEDTTLHSSELLIKTELSEIVREFNKMVRMFSGDAMSTQAKVHLNEVDNQFPLRDQYEGLYKSRQEPSFKYNVQENIKEESDTNLIGDFPQNLGSNRSGTKESINYSTRSINLLETTKSNGCSSPLFKWIVGLVVVPLLVSTVAISVSVAVSVSRELPEMVNDAERGLVDLQVASLEMNVALRAGYISRSSERSIRDLHLLTRYTSWLMFGGLQNSNTFREITTGIEACKNYSDIFACPYFQRNDVCDCAWNDAARCQEYSVDSRYLQKAYFASSSLDTWPNGDTNSTSYPLVAYSPATTAWWESQEDLPGAPTQTLNLTTTRNGRAYKTSYDRLRSAALVPLWEVMYNYDTEKFSVIHNFVAFEADGMISGYRGCENSMHARLSQWQSTELNGAALLRPDLCPLGKFGYDPRCRKWYESGKEFAMSENEPLHVTPPYLFAGNETVAQTSTAALIDPRTQEYVGQMLTDFDSTELLSVLNAKRTPLSSGGFPILITIRRDASDGDTVIGPGKSVVEEARPIEDVVQARDDLCRDKACGFLPILEEMRSGEAGNGVFVLDDGDGTPITVHLAYAPVVVKSFRQVNASDFSRGVEPLNYTLYSLALVEPQVSMLVPFEQATEDVDDAIMIGTAVCACLIVLSAILVVLLSYKITTSITEPMYYLLELMKHINRNKKNKDDYNGIKMHREYGSREVMHVQVTVERLYKLIRFANAAYFTGDIEIAYHIFSEALTLFTRLDNKKAMGVASNNLGNTMLTMFRTMEVTGQRTICQMGRREIIGKGMSYFHQAIQLGEKAYDAFYEAEGWSPNCLHFMQHLSNRYFNRAMFLLTVKEHHEKPDEMEELGLRDLEIARDMDVEIVAEGTQVGWGLRTSAAHFDVLLSRVQGHITVLELGYSDDWEVEHMLDDAFDILKTELKKESTDLFMDIGPAGRMQQLEHELMRYALVKGDKEKAAKIGIRMLMEDEFTWPESQKLAVQVLLDCCHDDNIQNRLEEYQEWLNDASDELEAQMSRTTTHDVASLELKPLSLSNQFHESQDVSMTENTEKRISKPSLRESMRVDITMENF